MARARDTTEGAYSTETLDDFLARADQVQDLAKRIVEAGRRLEQAMGEERLFMRCETSQVERVADKVQSELGEVLFELQPAVFHLVVALLVHDRVTVVAASAPGPVASGGYLEVGVQSITGDAFARGDAFLRNRSLVDGNLLTGGMAELQQDAAVTGQTFGQAFVPEHDLSWTVSFAGGESVWLEPDQAAAVQPGSYGAMRLGSRSSVGLSSGVYYVESLTLEPDSVLVLDQSAGPVVIYIQNQWIFRGAIETVSGEMPELVVGYFGQGAAHLEQPFAGTVIAPNGAIVLTSVDQAGFQGVFFGKRVEVRPDVQVEYMAPAPIF